MKEIQKQFISSDGTKIGYRQMGSGEGLIIVHGTGRNAESYRKLAFELSGKFTVYSYDRRGRGSSGPLSADHSIAKEVEDLVSLAAFTNASYIFGHSFGGVIALQAAEKCNILKLAVYEPPISINSSIPDHWIPEFEAAIVRGKKVKAMTVFLKALPPPEISAFPKWALRLLVLAVKFMERKKRTENKMLNLLYTIPADMKIVRELETEIDSYKRMETPVLLMKGTKSQAFFLQSVDWLSDVLPLSERKEFEGFDHYSPEEKVDELSAVLEQFFSEGNEPPVGH